MLVDGAPQPMRGEANWLCNRLGALVVDGSSTVAWPSVVPYAVLPMVMFPGGGLARHVDPRSSTSTGPRGARAPLGAEGSSRTFISIRPKLGLPCAHCRGVP